MKRISVLLAGAAIAALGACAGSDTKAVTANPGAESSEACCSDGGDKGGCGDACASDAEAGCCEGEKKSEP